MNIEVRQPLRAQKTRYGIVDCDIHPKLLLEDMRPYLSNQWWSHLQTYGLRPRHGFAKTYPMPKITPQAARRDAWPPTGGLPGSDLDFLREQLLDLYDMDYGIMNPLSPTGQGDQNPDFSAAMAFAANEAQLERLDRAREAAEGLGGGAVREPGSLRAPRSSAAPATRTSRRCSCSAAPRRRTGGGATGRSIRRRSRPGLPVGIHVFGYAGWPMTNSGWPSFYIEEMTEHATGQAGGGRQHDLRGPVRAVSATSRSC